MLDIFFSSNSILTARDLKQRTDIIWAGWLLFILGLSGMLGLFMYKFGPSPALIAWVIFVLGLIAILYKPRYGIYMIIFFSLVGDANMMPWYPFLKNFSSHESIFFLQDSLIFSPLEVYIVFTGLSWLIRGIVQRRFDFFKGELFWPAVVFMIFITLGLVYGLGRGGNYNIALWETRSIFYMFGMLVLASNLISRREHFNHLMWLAMIALFIEGIVGIVVYSTTYHGDLSGINSLTEHSAAIHMNTLFVFLIAAWMYHSSVPKRVILLLMTPVVLFTYVAADRRAAFISLAVAALLIFIMLFIENRKVFWLITPPLAVIGLLYCAAFWNGNGRLAAPVQAIKSVVDQSQASLEDQASNQYRVLENMNTSFTIHNAPLTGVGFGRMFYIIVQLPDISGFTWWQYITHNSVLWIWMNTGIFGFMALLYLIGTTIWLGARNVFRMPRGDLRAIALVAVLYIIMHFIYAYVDMSWDAQSMLYIGTMMGIINCMERVVAQPMPVPEKRWSWQPSPRPAPGLVEF
jgi:hypothetical protein